MAELSNRKKIETIKKKKKKEEKRHNYQKPISLYQGCGYESSTIYFKSGNVLMLALNENQNEML